MWGEEVLVKNDLKVGSCTAAMFLREFIHFNENITEGDPNEKKPNDLSWIHLDIAGFIEFYFRCHV